MCTLEKVPCLCTPKGKSTMDVEKHEAVHKLETSYINVHIWNVNMYMYYVCKWKLHIYVCEVEIGNRNPIYKCVQINKTYITYTMCKIYKHIWSKPHYRNTGITNLTIFTEIWCSHGCTTDGLVDAHKQNTQMNTKVTC